MRLETQQLAFILFAKDRTKPCPCCGDSLEEHSHLECRRALRRTLKRGGDGVVTPHVETYNLEYFTHPKWH